MAKPGSSYCASKNNVLKRKVYQYLNSAEFATALVVIFSLAVVFSIFIGESKGIDSGLIFQHIAGFILLIVLAGPILIFTSALMIQTLGLILRRK